MKNKIKIEDIIDDSVYKYLLDCVNLIHNKKRKSKIKEWKDKIYKIKNL